jgi:hypothetical protein
VEELDDEDAHIAGRGAPASVRTIDFALPAVTVVTLHRLRRPVELFFKPRDAAVTIGTEKVVLEPGGWRGGDSRTIRVQGRSNLRMAVAIGRRAKRNGGVD